MSFDDYDWNNQDWILEKCNLPVEEAEIYVREWGMLPLWHWEPRKGWYPPENPEWRVIGYFNDFDSLYSYWKTDFDETMKEYATQSAYFAGILNGRQFKSNGNGLASRYDVMKRDGYKCQICGRDANDGVKLEVDHKTPKARGGSDDYDNLWTLCFDCNRGKGTKSL